jgi:hypothetical protein
VELEGGSARFVNCSFEAVVGGNGTNSKDNGIAIITSAGVDGNGIYREAGKVTFGCPTGTTGADVPMLSSDLGTSQLPPAKQVVSCH